MWPNPQETADLVIFTEEILNGKLHFCAVRSRTVDHNICDKPVESDSVYSDQVKYIWWDFSAKLVTSFYP